MVLRNTHHGGPIETDHNLLVLLLTRACRHWQLAATTVATPAPMSTEIDDNIELYDDCLWSINLSTTKSKDVPAAGIPNTDAYLARVDRWVKPRTAATPRVLTAEIRTAKNAMINPRLRSGASGKARLRLLLSTTIDETSVLPLPTEQQ